MGKHSREIQEAAKNLFLKGLTVSEIAEEISVPERTVGDWRQKGRWDEIMPAADARIALTRRLVVLADRENKTNQEIKELDVLMARAGKMEIDQANAEKIRAEAEWIRKHGPATSQRSRSSNKSASDKDKAVKNDVSGVTEEILKEIREKIFWKYQLRWWANKDKKHRMILKSRQIGATFYFAFEALEDAILTGGNQIFLSASRDQAEVFKAYIIAFAKEYFDIELKGSGFITLSNGAQLRFLSTNRLTAQSYTGNLYKDEVHWMMKYDKISEVADGMASHKKWRITEFSTPSAKSHPAWKRWDGSEFNADKDKNERVDIDISHKALKEGAMGGDRIWRNIVTLLDAEKDGCDLFDVEDLRARKSRKVFDNLYLCKPIDDSESIFKLSLLSKCMVDYEEWKDYKPNAERPFDNKKVTFGYDPSKTGHGASLAILNIPDKTKPFRLLASNKFHGRNFTWQGNRIREFFEKHNVQFFGLDDTGGTGMAVGEKVQEFYPLLTTFHYSPQIKSLLVGKALDLMETGRFQYLASESDVTRAFMMITETTTASGNAVTYQSSVTQEDGKEDHADQAWAIMHAMQAEPIAPRKQTTVTFSD